MGNEDIEQFEKDNVVCPFKFWHGLFTVGAIDNIDLVASSATGMPLFHGTAACLYQKVPHKEAGEKEISQLNFQIIKI